MSKQSKCLNSQKGHAREVYVYLIINPKFQPPILKLHQNDFKEI